MKGLDSRKNVTGTFQNCQCNAIKVRDRLIPLSWANITSTWLVCILLGLATLLDGKVFLTGSDLSLGLSESCKMHNWCPQRELLPLRKGLPSKKIPIITLWIISMHKQVRLIKEKCDIFSEQQDPQVSDRFRVLVKRSFFGSADAPRNCGNFFPPEITAS